MSDPRTYFSALKQLWLYFADTGKAHFVRDSDIATFFDTVRSRAKQPFMLGVSKFMR